MQPNNNQAATTNYNTALAEYGSVYDPQIQAVQAEEAQALQTKNTALSQYQQDNTTRLSQLDQAKVNAFSNNSLASNAKGLFYSGYTPAENSAYVTNTYNPNVQAANTNYQRNVDNTNTTYNNNYQTLQDKIAQINQSRANDAYSLVQNTKQAQLSAAKSATSAAKAGAPTATQAKQSFSNASLQTLVKESGKDAHISPEAYANEAIKWLNAGYSISDFNSVVSANKLLDPNNGYYNYALTEALKRSK
jgi:hypothetical protein